MFSFLPILTPAPHPPGSSFNLDLFQVVSPGHTQSEVLGLNSGMRYAVGRPSPQKAWTDLAVQGPLMRGTDQNPVSEPQGGKDFRKFFLDVWVDDTCLLEVRFPILKTVNINIYLVPLGLGLNVYIFAW